MNIFAFITIQLFNNEYIENADTIRFGHLKIKNKDLKVYEGKESHKKIKEDFMETFDKEYSGNNKNILRISFNHFGMIKRFRVRADYHDSNINHEEYNTRIKTDLLKLLNSLKQIEK